MINLSWIDPLWIILILLSGAVFYLIWKIRQPIIVRSSKKGKDEVPDLSDLGDILLEIQPEIERNLNLNEDQKKILGTWINTINKVTKSKLSTWLIDKLGGYM